MHLYFLKTLYWMTLASLSQQPHPHFILCHLLFSAIVLFERSCRASGLDGILPTGLKHCGLNWYLPYVMFQLSLALKVFFHKLVQVQPVPKNDYSSCLLYHQLAALTWVSSKVMQKGIYIQLLSYLESHHIFNDDHQYSFWQNRSTGDVLPYITHISNNAIFWGTIWALQFGEVLLVPQNISKVLDSLEF